MAMNSPTTIEAAIPTAPAPSQPAAQPNLAPTQSTQTHSTDQNTPTQTQRPAPISLESILASRNAPVAPEVKLGDVAPVQEPNAANADPNAQPVQKVEEPQADPQKPNTDQAAAMWELAQKDPEALIKLLQAVAPQEQPAKNPDNEPFNAQTYAQQAHQQAIEIFNQRPSITLSGLLGGAENLQELGLSDADFS